MQKQPQFKGTLPSSRLFKCRCSKLLQTDSTFFKGLKRPWILLTHESVPLIKLSDQDLQKCAFSAVFQVNIFPKVFLSDNWRKNSFKCRCNYFHCCRVRRIYRKTRFRRFLE